MKTLLLASAIALTSHTALAHDEYYTNQCNLEVNADIRITHDDILITTENNQKILINGSHELYVDGESIDLSRAQANDIRAYYEGIYQAVPATINIASSALQIASSAVELSLGQLLGEDDELVTTLSEQFNNISVELKRKVYADDGSINFSFNSEEDSFFDQEWEDNLENEIENAISASIGKLMIALGTELLFSGGDTDAFEQKMESFAANIEEKIETEATYLETQAENLCEQVRALDDLENDLQNDVDALKGLDLFHVSKSA